MPTDKRLAEAANTSRLEAYSLSSALVENPIVFSSGEPDHVRSFMLLQRKTVIIIARNVISLSILQQRQREGRRRRNPFNGTLSSATGPDAAVEDSAQHHCPRFVSFCKTASQSSMAGSRHSLSRGCALDSMSMS